MFGLGMPEVILILVIAMVVFGPSKLPAMGASMGKAIREFQSAVKEPDLAKDAKAAAAGLQEASKPKA